MLFGMKFVIYLYNIFVIYSYNNKRVLEVAKPIKITPVLKGDDAVNFYRSLRESDEKRVSKDALFAIRRDADKLKSLFKRRKQ